MSIYFCPWSFYTSPYSVILSTCIFGNKHEELKGILYSMSLEISPFVFYVLEIISNDFAEKFSRAWGLNFSSLWKTSQNDTRWIEETCVSEANQKAKIYFVGIWDRCSFASAQIGLSRRASYDLRKRNWWVQQRHDDPWMLNKIQRHDQNWCFLANIDTTETSFLWMAVCESWFLQ